MQSALALPDAALFGLSCFGQRTAGFYCWTGRRVASRSILGYCGSMTTKRVAEPRFTKSNTD